MSLVVSDPTASADAPALRTRLLDLLLPARGLVLVRGVRGSGRTTLASAWLLQRRAAGSTGAWIDGRAAYAQEGALAAAIASALGLRSAGGLDALAPALLELPGPVDVVLDDADSYLNDESGRSLASLVARVPGLTVVVIARRVGLQDVAAVDLPSRTLHATADELRMIVAAAGIDIAPEDVDVLHSWFRGWLIPSLAAARAWAASLSAGNAPAVARRTAREVGVASVAENSSSLSAERQLLPLWLWQLADELTPETASLAFGTDKPMPVILALEAEGAVEPVSGPSPRWRLALGEVLADALFARFESTHAALAQAAHRRLADFALDQDRPAEALRHAVASRDWEHTAHLLHTQWATILVSNKSVLRDALNALPADFTDRYPRWAQAKAYVNHMPVAGDVRPVRFTSPPPPEATDLMDVLATSTARLAADRVAGRVMEARAAVTDIAEILADVSDEQLAPILPALAELRTQWARTYFFSGSLGLARIEYETTYDEAVTHDNARIAVAAAGSLVLIHALSGQTEQAELWLDRTPDYPSTDAPDTVHAAGNLGRAVLALNRLDLDRAEEILNEDSRIAEASEYAALHASARAVLAGWRGEAAAALHTLRSQRSAAGPRWASGLNPVVLADTHASLLALGGRYNDAAQALDVEAADERLRETLLVARARTSLAAGYPEAAATDARRALTSPALTVRSAIGAHIVLAAALAAGGDPGAGEADAATAVTLAQQNDLPAALTAVSAVDLDRLADVLPPEALDRIRSVALPPRSRSPLPTLTPREREILGQIVAGLSVGQMAEAAFVSRNTVKGQIHAVYRKLDVHSRKEAIARIHEAGLLSR